MQGLRDGSDLEERRRDADPGGEAPGSTAAFGADPRSVEGAGLKFVAAGGRAVVRGGFVAASRASCAPVRIVCDPPASSAAGSPVGDTAPARQRLAFRGRSFGASAPNDDAPVPGRSPLGAGSGGAATSPEHRPVPEGGAYHPGIRGPTAAGEHGLVSERDAIRSAAAQISGATAAGDRRSDCERFVLACDCFTRPECGHRCSSERRVSGPLARPCGTHSDPAKEHRCSRRFDAGYGPERCFCRARFAGIPRSRACRTKAFCPIAVAREHWLVAEGHAAGTGDDRRSSERRARCVFARRTRSECQPRRFFSAGPSRERG